MYSVQQTAWMMSSGDCFIVDMNRSQKPRLSLLRHTMRMWIMFEQCLHAGEDCGSIATCAGRTGNDFE